MIHRHTGVTIGAGMTLSESVLRMEETLVQIEEHVLSVLRVLPPAQQREVLEFAEFLQQRGQPAVFGSTPELLPLPVLEGVVPAGWKEAIYDGP